MREIKFRAWDEQAKEMHHDFQFIKSGDLNEGGSDWIIPLEPITNPDWVVRLTEHCKTAPHFRDQFHLMQYTGLKDKNGKEIYEGDILHLDAYGNYTVDYKDVGFETSYIGVLTEGFLSMNDFYDQEDANSYEVIGNIYETPELLEKNNDITFKR